MAVLTNIERKAVRLCVEGKVQITLRDGDTIAGRVIGDTGEYLVQVDPEGHHCSCIYGEHHPHMRHSHTIALVLQAEADAQGYDIQKELTR